MLIIKTLRKNNNESQTDLSLILGVSLRTVQNYESGKVTIPNDKLSKIAQHYDVSVSYLFESETEKKLKNTPILEKNGVNLTIKEILLFIIDNESELKSDTFFLRYITEIGREAIIKYLTDNDMIKK